MYKQPKYQKGKLKINESYVGESIEAKVDRIMNNKEPITDGAPQIYTERKEGVKPEYDIRTDRFDVAVEAMDSISKTHVAARENKGKVVKMDDKKGEKTGDGGDAGGESTQGTK